MSTLTVSARPERDARLRPVPWRRMAWVIWRQHRVALTAAALFLGALSGYLWLAGVDLHHAYAAATACSPVTSFTCNNLSHEFNYSNSLLANGVPLQVVPALIGVFVGAPVLARELETGTFRYAWTQGFGRWRWTLAKLSVLAVLVVAAAAAITALFAWYYQPYFPAANQRFGLAQLSSLAPGVFDLRGVVFAAWALAAFAIGVFAGMLVRRVVPAIVAGLAAYTGLAIAAGAFLRQRYLAPVVTSSLHLPDTAWIVRQQWVNQAGHVVSQSVLGQVLQQGAPQLTGKGGVPQALSTWQYLARHGYTRWTTYQPASRFWTFQWIEGGWLLALSVLLIGLTVWLARRRAA